MSQTVQNDNIHLIEIPFNGDSVFIYPQNGRPFVPIDPICNSLGIKVKNQIKRLQKQAAHADLVIIQFPVDGKQWHAIPIEDLSWFLRTARPQDEAILKKLAIYRQGIVWVLLWYWFQHADTYLPPAQFRDNIRSIHPPKPALPPRKKPRLNMEHVKEMKQLKARGIAQVEIARLVGFGASTVSECLKGTYPVSVQHDEDL